MAKIYYFCECGSMLKGDLSQEIIKKEGFQNWVDAHQHLPCPMCGKQMEIEQKYNHEFKKILREFKGY